ncbi:MAG TPA: MFS transporter, partial [Candidatus Limnocylindrales bacterium]|nr:MFS transporter [Candidatus Limnocylindrales bacterium]
PVTPAPAASVVPARTADLFAPGLRGLTLGIVATVTLVALESLAIGIAVAIVAEELGGIELFGWVYSAFFLGTLIGTVVAGGALDRFPLHRPFAVGLLLFAVGLLIGGLAPTMPILILARFIQGLGGGAITPTAYVAIGRGLPDRLQPRMFAMMSAAWVVPGIIGPSLAAIVVQLAGWRWVFLGLLPLLAIAGGLAVASLRRIGTSAPPEEHAAAASTLKRVPGALVAAAGAGILLAALTVPEPLIALGMAAAGLALLVPAYRRLTPPGTLRLARGVPAAVLVRGLMTFAFFSADALLSALLQTWLERPPVLTGVVFTVTTVAWSGATWFQARWIDRVGPVRFVAVGFGLIALGSALTIPVALRLLPPEATIVTWFFPGIGMGLMYSAATLVVLRRSPQQEQGSNSAAMQMSDILGTALGAGVGGALLAAGERAGGDAIGIGLALVFAVSLAASVAGVLSAGRLGAVSTVRNAAGGGVD